MKRLSMNETINYIRHQFLKFGIIEKLIYSNVVVFVMVVLTNVIAYFFQNNSNILLQWFALPDTFEAFIVKPWTIITYGFLHQSFLHLLFNLIALFFIGNLFKQYFTSKDVLNVYVFGTLCGGLVFLLSYNLFPVFVNDYQQNILLGASAGILAIFIAIATHIPNYAIKIPLIGFVKLHVLALIWVGLDMIQIPVNNPGGHLAHLGGAFFGFLYVQQIYGKKNSLFSAIKKWRIFNKTSPLKTVYKAPHKQPKATSKNQDQRQVDAILDKISKSGYEALTKKEKEFLFKQGNH